MILLDFLTPDTIKVYKLLMQKVKIVENSAICRKHNVFGWYSSPDKILTICTNRINGYETIQEYINETLLHEAVHVAQHCKGRANAMVPLHIAPALMPLSQRRQQDMKTAVKINGPMVKQNSTKHSGWKTSQQRCITCLRSFAFRGPRRFN